MTTPSEAFYSPSGRISQGTFTLRLAVTIGALVGAVMAGNGLIQGSIILFCFYLIPVQFMKRGRDAGWGAWVGLLAIIPGVNILAALGLMAVPAKTQ